MSRSRLLIAERFVAPIARLSEAIVPLDVIAQQRVARLRVFVIGENDERIVTLSQPSLSASDKLRLAFAPFDSAAGAPFILGAVDSADDVGHDRNAIRNAANGRTPIVLHCSGGTDDLLLDERTITASRIAAPAPQMRTAHWLDVFWCDAHGVYLEGWAHAYEHRVRALRVESAGRVARTESLGDRADLLAHYPDHDHVRHSGFAIYLACPPRHPVTLVLETDDGDATLALPLPEGQLPKWEAEPETDDDMTPTMRRFGALANALGGRVLQIGSRIPIGAPPVPPRDFVRKLVGLDIHPGCNVDVAGDAHVISRFFRPRSFDGVLSSSVLEHVEAPWVLAAEINRVLKPGGVVYHQVPGAWPAHAQPNDFWRFSSEGLRVLFGAATGFEIVDARDCGHAAIIPSPQWRKKHLTMPVIPAFAMAEIVARKVAEVDADAIAWPLAGARATQYPLAGLRT